MVSSAEILAAFREVSNTKQLDRAELYALLQDGILAALAKKYGPNVQAEVNIDDGKGDIRIVLLKTVVATVEDASNQISIEDAKTFDELSDICLRLFAFGQAETRKNGLILVDTKYELGKTKSGEIVVTFVLDRTGHILSSSIVTSSGDSSLDAAALDMLQVLHRDGRRT